MIMSKTMKITEIAIAAALAVLCSFIRVYTMPQGGSISLTMVPLFVIAFRRGTLPGIITGAMYGVLSLAIDGVIYHPLSVFLDYIFAFGIVGISGLFPKSNFGIVSGVICGVFGRFVFSLISGATLFAGYAPEWQNPWAYSAIYQASYLVPELIICVVAMLFINIKAHKILIGK